MRYQRPSRAVFAGNARILEKFPANSLLAGNFCRADRLGQTASTASPTESDWSAPSAGRPPTSIRRRGPSARECRDCVGLPYLVCRRSRCRRLTRHDSRRHPCSKREPALSLLTPCSLLLAPCSLLLTPAMPPSALSAALLFRRPSPTVGRWRRLLYFAQTNSASTTRTSPEPFRIRIGLRSHAASTPLKSLASRESFTARSIKAPVSVTGYPPSRCRPARRCPRAGRTRRRSAGSREGRRRGVLVVDRDGEEFQKPAHGVFAGRGDDRSSRASDFERRQRPGFDCHKVG